MTDGGAEAEEAEAEAETEKLRKVREGREVLLMILKEGNLTETAIAAAPSMTMAIFFDYAGEEEEEKGKAL